MEDFGTDMTISSASTFGPEEWREEDGSLRTLRDCNVKVGKKQDGMERQLSRVHQIRGDLFSCEMVRSLAEEVSLAEVEVAAERLAICMHMLINLMHMGAANHAQTDG